MKKNNILAALFILVAFAYPLTAKDDVESQLDEIMLGKGSETSSSSDADRPKWDFFGYVESENFFGLDSANTTTQNEFIKLEARSRLNVKYGTNFFYGKAVLDLYFYPEIALQNPMSAGLLDPYEFYISAGKELQFKVGKIVYNWGSADAFRITNYFDQRDLRELFMKEEDERYRGSYSINLKYLFGDFAVEGVAVANLNPILFPAAGSYWSISPAVESGVQPVLHTTQPPGGYQNISAGLRAGGTIGVFDFHLSYFNGTNSSIIMVPEVTADLLTQNVAAIDLYTDYERVNKLGLDTALNIDKLALRLESVLTFDQNALYSDTSRTIVLETDMVNHTVRVARDTARVPYLAFTAGLDYNLWGQNGRFLVEYTNGFFTENHDLYDKEFFTNFLLLTLQDKFFDEHLEVKLTGIIRPDTDPGFMAGGSLAYDFQNGLVLTAGAMIFAGGSDSMLQIYENSDLAYFRARMNF